MTPQGRGRTDACTLLSLLQTLNLFALSLWAPPVDLSRWVFALLFASCVFALQAFNKRVFDHLQILETYAAWTDRVPRFKEFPRVYSYLLLTVAIFIPPIIVLTGPTA